MAFLGPAFVWFYYIFAKGISLTKSRRTSTYEAMSKLSSQSPGGLLEVRISQLLNAIILVSAKHSVNSMQ